MDPSNWANLRNERAARSTSKIANLKTLFTHKNLALSVHQPFPIHPTISERRKRRMPLYDCVMLMKPHVKKEALMELVVRVGKHVYRRNGVVTDMKSFGTVQLGYGIKKLDGRYFQGQLMQMTMMATPNINKELHYLNKEDRLLRWLLVKHRDTKYGLEFMSEEDGQGELNKLSRSSIYDEEDVDEYEEDSNDDESQEYEVERQQN